MRNGEATLIETDGGYPTDEALTFKIVNEKFDDVDLIIKDENGKVFTALDNKTSKSAKDGSLVIAVSGTAYTGSFDVTGIDGATTTTSPLPTSVAVGSTGTTLAGVDIDGTKAVTVTIKTAGLTEKAPEYKADVSAVNGKTLESLSVNTANDKALTLSVAATPNTGIVANSNVKLTVKLSSAPQDAYSYKVTLTVNGEEKSVVLDQSNATAGADIWVNNVTSDVNVTAAQVEVASPLMAIENVEWTTGSVTITF